MQDEPIIFGNRSQYRAFKNGTIQSRMSRGGNGIILKEWRDLIPRKCRTDRYGGYYYNVTAGFNKGQDRIHVIICTLFHGPKPRPGYEVDHIDGCRENNSAENLRWATRKENMENAKQRGAWKKLTDQALAFEDDAQFLAVMTQINAGVTPKEMSRRYGLSASKFSRLRNMKRQVGFVYRHKWLSKYVEPRDKFFGGQVKGYE